VRGWIQHSVKSDPGLQPLNRYELTFPSYIISNSPPSKPADIPNTLSRSLDKHCRARISYVLASVVL
jgi:hypothetical protein